MKPSDLLQSEYFEYYSPYVALVGDITLLEALEKGLMDTKLFFKALPKEKQVYQYDEGKWTPKEVLLHITDTERVLCYRAMYFARAKNSTIEGFDENTFASNSNANKRTIDDLLNEFIAVRTATICMFKSFGEAALKRGGMANNNLLSVRALGFIICGHSLHHENVIKERYLH